MQVENVRQKTGVFARQHYSFAFPLVFLLSWSFQKEWSGENIQFGVFWTHGIFSSDNMCVSCKNRCWLGHWCLYTRSGSCFASDERLLTDNFYGTHVSVGGCHWKLCFPLIRCYHLQWKIRWLFDFSHEWKDSLLCYSTFFFVCFPPVSHWLK